MNLTQYRCINCGANEMKIVGNTCECKHCGTVFYVDTAKEFAEEVRKVFGDVLAGHKEEQIANCRRNLWNAVHAEHVSTNQVLACVHELKKLLPDDFQANFYEVATCGTPKQLNTFLRNIDVVKNGFYIEDIVDYILRSLESSTVLPLKDLITRGLKDNKYTEYITKVEDEAAKIKQGIYSPQVPRDVFVAYSSKDYKAVNEIVEFLEENKISCFVALRNLRHGRGSVENYLNNLQTAMHNCKCVVFLSSDNSRDLDCDALKVELPYIKSSGLRMGRIEYILSDYGRDTSYAAKLILEDFFNGQEYCRTKEDLIKRALKYITGNMGETAVAESIAEEVKYCITCGEKNPVKAKRCMECGSSGFADTYESYLRAKFEKEYAEKYRRQQLAENTAVKAETYRKEENYSTLNNYNGTEFKINGTTLIKYKGKKAEVDIPYGITAIGARAFLDCNHITSVKIPDSVITIGERAFERCKSITNITIPDSVITIGENAFSDCSGLKTIHCQAQSKPKTWHSQWIGYCMADVVWGYKILQEQPLKSAPYYPTLANYDKSEFEIEGTTLVKYRGEKTEALIPDGVTHIGDYAMSSLGLKLESIILPDSVKSIGKNAFRGLCYIKNIKIPGSVTTIEQEAFWNCFFESITIPEGVTSIGNLAFGGCGSLKHISLPDSITTMGREVFRNCGHLESIIIPKNVINMGESLFSKCENLKTIYCAAPKKPKDWPLKWRSGCNAEVVWGYKGK